MLVLKQILQKYLNYICVVLITVLVTMLLIVSVLYYFSSKELSEANAKLAVIDNASEETKVQTVIIEKKIEVIKWKTKENLHIEKEYIYDTNKSECCNGIDRMRRTFSGMRDENGLLEMSGREASETNSSRLQ